MLKMNYNIPHYHIILLMSEVVMTGHLNTTDERDVEKNKYRKIKGKKE